VFPVLISGILVAFFGIVAIVLPVGKTLIFRLNIKNLNDEGSDRIHD